MPTILVIDDDPDIRSLLVDALEGAGYAVRTASDGETGLAAAVASKPDLIVLDWMMPERSGLEVAHHLRSEHLLDDVPVVMLTARGTQADIEWGYAAGIDGYVVKPFSPRALIWRIQSMLAKGRRPELIEERAQRLAE